MTTGTTPGNPKARRKVTLGPVSLVAAGPGDPDLLTLRAVALLGEADVIVSDVDVVAIAETYRRADAQIIPAVSTDGIPLDHADRVKLVVEAAREGKDVVRLIAGDPVVDGDTAEADADEDDDDDDDAAAAPKRGL